MKFSIRQKLIIISCILLIVPIAVLGTTSYFYAKNQLTQKGETILRNGVQQAMMLIEAKKQEVARGTISLEEAQEEAKTMLLGPRDAEGKRSISKSVDLGENGYFIVYSTSGDEIMHPTLEGQNVWDAEDKSGNGFKLVQAQLTLPSTEQTAVMSLTHGIFRILKRSEQKLLIRHTMQIGAGSFLQALTKQTSIKVPTQFYLLF